MQTIFQEKPDRALGDVGLEADTFGDFERVPVKEGFDPFDRRKPRSSVEGALPIEFLWEREGHAPRNKVLEDLDGNPVLNAYVIHDHGLYAGRGDQVLMVPLKDVEDLDSFKEARAVVRIYLDDDEDTKLYEDVLPNVVKSAMAKSAQAAELIDAQAAFWMLEKDRHAEELRKAGEIEEPALTADPVDGGPIQAERRELNFTDAALDLSMVERGEAHTFTLSEGADMSAGSDWANLPYAEHLGQAYHDLTKNRSGKLPPQFGLVLAHAVKAKLLSEDNVAEVLAAAVTAGPDKGRRISAITVEELREDRWKLKLWCREDPAHGRATSSHTAYITPRLFAMEYRVTGGEKYPHQVEVKKFVQACIDEVLSSWF